MIEYFEDPNTMPVVRYFKFNSLMALSDEVGCTLEDMMMRDRSALQFLEAGDIESAKKELRNKSLTHHFLTSGFSPKGTALAALVKSIDGVSRDDLSEGGLMETLKMLSDKGLTRTDLEGTTERLKKKSNRRWKFSYPMFLNRMFSTASILKNT